MEDTLQKILKKLDVIETRLDAVEVKSTAPAPKPAEQKKQAERDPLFDKAVAIVNKIESEISTSEMQKQLNVDFKRAEKILDQLAEAGFGTTYMGEA